MAKKNKNRNKNTEVEDNNKKPTPRSKVPGTVSAKVGSVKAGTLKGPISCKFDPGTNLEEMLENYSEEHVYEHAKANIIVSVQDVIRKGINDDLDQKAIQKNVNEWQPGAKRRGKSKTEKAMDAFFNLSDDEKAALMERINQ